MQINWNKPLKRKERKDFEINPFYFQQITYSLNSVFTFRINVLVSGKEDIQELRMTQHHFIQSVQRQKSIGKTLSLVLFLVDDLNSATQNSKNFGTFKFIPEKQPKELKNLTQVSFNVKET